VTKRHVVSRPIPLEYLRLGSFNEPPEQRREKPEGGSLLGIRRDVRPMYPFTLYHASAKTARRYTLYAPSEEKRRKWEEAIKDACVVGRVSMEANMVGGRLMKALPMNIS
jgi:RHO1 GDP-GTP exchange protein 1/2